MAQPVQQVALRAPGFEGLNTELSPINGDPEFALVADNVVVDQIGRLVNREAFADYINTWGEAWELLFRQIDDPAGTDAGMSNTRHYANEGCYFYAVIDPDGDPTEDDGTEAVSGDNFYSAKLDPSISWPEWGANARGTIRYQAMDRFPQFIDPPSLSNPADQYQFRVKYPRLEVRIPSGLGKGKTVGTVRVSAVVPAPEGSGQSNTVQNVSLVSDGSNRIRISLDFALFSQNASWTVSLYPITDYKEYCESLGVTPSMTLDVNSGTQGFVVYYRLYDETDSLKQNQELVRLGVQKYDNSNSDWGQQYWNDNAVAIYRWGSRLEEGPQRTIPSGFKSRKIGKALELDDPLYDLAIQQGNTLLDLNLPGDFGGYRGRYLADAVFVNFKDRLFLFCHEQPFVEIRDRDVIEVAGGINYGLDPVATTTQKIDGDIAISAYGRLWVTGVNGDYNTIYYSSLLDETSWYDERVPPATEAEEASYVPPYNVQNDAGVIDVREYWPIETDRIMGIHAHNGFLLVFGRNSILIYANADRDPAGEDGIQLQDTISNIGLVHKYAIANIGTDVLFVDDSGVRSLGRVIQEKSTPIAEPSLNIRREIRQLIAEELALDSEQSKINFRFFPNRSLAVLLFRSKRLAYVFHLNGLSKTGGMKITRWTDCTWNDAVELIRGFDDLMVMAGTPNKGLLKYDGYLEGDSDADPDPYIMRYESMAVALGQSPMQTTIPKSIHYVCMGEFIPGQANALWGFSDRMIGSREFQVEVEGGSEYSVNEFTDDGSEELAGYYPDGGPYYKGYKINTTGSGELFRVGFEVKVQGGRYALQEIDINSAVGRLTA